MTGALLALFVLLPLGVPAITPARGWILVPNRMTDERWSPAACLLADGKSAVIAGGYSYAKAGCVASIDLYDEATGRFRRSRAHLTYPRDFAQANRLPDGRVLISGGFSDVWASLKIAEMYDPASDTCQVVACPMKQHRELFQAVTLADGRVLLTGGLDLWARGTVATAELFDPRAEQFTPTRGNMAGDRFGHAACLLADGRVLVVGGTHWNLHRHDASTLDSAEIYDPAADSFHATAGRLDTPRDRPTATLLPDGKVLIAGGQGQDGKAVRTAELFDPRTEQFTPLAVAPLTPRMAHSAACVGSTVVIAGGWDADAKATTSSTLAYDAAANAFTPMPDLPVAVLDMAEVAFPDGSFLVAGGKIAKAAQASSTDRAALLKVSR